MFKFNFSIFVAKILYYPDRYSNWESHSTSRPYLVDPNRGIDAISLGRPFTCSGLSVQVLRLPGFREARSSTLAPFASRGADPCVGPDAGDKKRKEFTLGLQPHTRSIHRDLEAGFRLFGVPDRSSNH
jgi:hypothetical protein